jgi:alcohol dehydrogenase (cytochrome c)
MRIWDLPSRLTLALATLGVLASQVPAQGTIAFSRAQSERGAGVYAQHCADCHGSGLSGGRAMALTGAEFRARWSAPSRSLYELLELVRETMPVGNEGGLSADEYLAVLTFILERNDVVAGDRALAADRAVLESLRLPAPPASSTASMEAKGGGAAPSAASLRTPSLPTLGAVTAGPRGTTPKESGPSQDELRAAATNGRDWLTHTRDYTGSRYSPLAQVTSGNVSRLRVACTFQVGVPSSFQTGPVVHDGVMYLTSGYTTMAIDAATCRPKWRHDWQSSIPAGLANRGVAVKDGRVLRGTGDGHLLALDAADGTLLWSTRIGDVSKGEMFSMPPLVYDDLVFIAPAVGEFGIRGWIQAHRIADGQKVWRFNIVPAPGEPGSETWRTDAPFPLGGGAVWTPLALDVAREILYVPAANPAPDFPVDERGGTNLYTNSVIALEARTGKLSWYQQMVPLDDHDWDLTQVSPLYQATANGKRRDLVATVGKDGILRVVDRASRERIFETPVTTMTNVDAPITKEGTRACPGVFGGVQWNGPAYHPGANLLVVPAVDWCSTFKLSDEIKFVPFQNYLGGSAAMDKEQRGWLTAVDASTGAVRWRYQSPKPMVGAVTTTAGGLVFAAELTGDLIAFDAATGAELFRHFTGGQAGGGVVTYEVKGRQYVAVASGTTSRFWADRFEGSPTITIFALDGGR